MAIHDGHRERLRKKFRDGEVEDHELLELFLYAALSRVNTNEIAHALLEKFGSIKGVFDASEKALLSVDGIGPQTAFHIKVVAKCIEKYHFQTFVASKRLNSYSKIKEYLVGLFSCISEERAYVLLFSNSKKIIRCEKIGMGTASFTEMQAYKIFKLANELGAASVAIAHNHPGGVAIPSEQDIKLTREIKTILEGMKIAFLDHFIVAGEVCTPVLGSSLFNKKVDN